MPIESVNRNYERNREIRGKRRHFKGAATESTYEPIAKTSTSSRKSRMDMPTRSAKSLNNLSLIDKEAVDPGTSSNQNAALTPITKIIKWCKHISQTRENPSPVTQAKVIPVEQKSSPPRYQQTGYVGRKRGFMGPLGLGEFVESMGEGFDELDHPNGSSQIPVKSRSLIDISMTNLWGDEDDEGLENDDNGSSGPGENNEQEASLKNERKVSFSQPSRSSLLSTISRLVPLPPIAPNLVQFLDNPSVSGNVYESTETTFFGNTEDRWSAPAFLVTACSQMQRGDLFDVSPASLKQRVMIKRLRLFD